MPDQTGTAAPIPVPGDGADAQASSESTLIRRATVWVVGGQYVSFAMQFVTSVVISRWFLAPSQVGLFSIALSLALVVAVMQDFGLSRHVAGLSQIGPDELARCCSVALVMAGFVAALIAAAAIPAEHFYHQPNLASIVWIVAASTLCLPFTMMPLAVLGRTLRFHGHFAVNAGGALVQGSFAIGLAAMGCGSFALAWAMLAGAIARGLIAQSLQPALPWPFRLDGIGPIIGVGSRLTLVQISSALGTRTPDMVVGRLLDLRAVGFYGRAVSLSDQFRMLIAGAVGTVFFPAFARIRDRGDPLGPAYLRVVAGYTAILWPGMAGLALAAQPIVRLLYGQAWAGVAPVLSLVALMDIVLCAMPLHIEIPILMGRTNRLLAINAVDTVMSLVLLAAGCRWGLEGAAASRLVYAVGWAMLYGRFIHSLVRCNRAHLLAVYGKSALAAVAGLAPLTIVYALWMPPGAITFPVLVGAVCAGLLLWLAVLHLVRHPALADIAALAGHFVRFRRPA